MVPCREIQNLNIDELRGGQLAFAEFAFCVKFEEGDSIKGTLGSKVLRFLEIRIDPCQETEPVTDIGSVRCLSTIFSNPNLLASAPPEIAVPLKQNITDTIRSMQLIFSFLDSKANPNSYDIPLSQNINSNSKIKASISSEKTIEFLFGEITVKSSGGT